MPIIDPLDETLKNLTGIHLWHYGLSSCSQRVRIALAEKCLKYTSHVIDLQLGENASPEYQAIHPDGLVPAIVIDGDLVIESVDILSELDKRFMNGSLSGDTTKSIKQIKKLTVRANKAQSALKFLTFEFLFSVLPLPPKNGLDRFQLHHKNKKLKKFHRDFERGFSNHRISENVQKIHTDFLYLDSLLSDGRSFLAGDAFSLADIAWLPNVHRFDLINWPYERYQYLQAWFQLTSTRPSYAKGLTTWEPKQFIDEIAPKVLTRQMSGKGVDSFVSNLSTNVWEGKSAFSTP